MLRIIMALNLVEKITRFCHQLLCFSFYLLSTIFIHMKDEFVLQPSRHLFHLKVKAMFNLMF